ncbi:hypothetical protein [Algoriphagus sp.]|uniref:hypothetical protein n=1 Tax=Algoriphagus sp. TaxID=1872435 RepID=UPI00391D6480
MKYRFIAILILMLVGSQNLYSQDYIILSDSEVRGILRVSLGATQFSLREKDSLAQSAYGIHLSNEVKLLSYVWNKEKSFTFHDAFYLDLSFGRMNNEPRELPSKGESESRFSYVANMGYLLLPGYRNPKWALLAGLDFRWRAVKVGEYTFPNVDGPLLYYSRPLVIRAEYALSKEIADKRAIFMMWYDNGTAKRTNYLSARLEYPIGEKGRSWIYFQYTGQSALGEDTFTPSDAKDTKFNQLILGVRIQNAIL